MELNDQVLSQYLDGELDERARAEINAALANDAGARARLERLRGADELLREAIPKFAHSDKDPLVRHILSYEEGSPKLAPAPRRRAAAAMIALAAGITGLAIGIIGSGLLGQTRAVMDSS